MSFKFLATGEKFNFSGFLFGSTGVGGVPPLLLELLSSSLQPVNVDAKVNATAPLAVLVMRLRRLMCCSKISRK